MCEGVVSLAASPYFVFSHDGTPAQEDKVGASS